jgi:hypothetical protein
VFYFLQLLYINDSSSALIALFIEFLIASSYFANSFIIMKKVLILIPMMAMYASSWAQTQVKIVTVVESIVPMGVGRSRIIETNEVINPAPLTTTRTEDKNYGQGKVDRDDVKVENFNETKLLNLYSGVGINFQNIASNDAVISGRLNQLLAEGWKISHVLGGVESNAGQQDGQGIFMTRFILTK